jgi:DNA-binding response OmpR family regulator
MTVLEVSMENKQCNILVIDDEPVICDLLGKELSERGYRCIAASDGKEALAVLAADDFDVTLIDIRLPKISGMEVLRRIQLNYPTVAAIMITAINDADVAVEAMKIGASDYIVKPFEIDKLDASIRKASEIRKGLAVRDRYEGLNSFRYGKAWRTGTNRTYREMDAIAYGLDRRIDQIVGHSRIVTEETVKVARQLGLPEAEVQNWVSARISTENMIYKENSLPTKKVKPNLFTEGVVCAIKTILCEPDLE